MNAKLLTQEHTLDEVLRDQNASLFYHAGLVGYSYVHMSAYAYGLKLRNPFDAKET